MKSCLNIMSTASLLISKNICRQNRYFATGILRFRQKGIKETQSNGIHGVQLFNTEFPIYYRVVFKYSCFWLFCEWREILLP